ncbi:MAG: peroxiredoxin family protein [Thermomicrobiales bacterium]
MAPIEVGSSAPDMTAPHPDSDGTPRSIAAALAGGPVLLGVYKSSCQASKTMFPMLERIMARRGSEGLSVIGVAQDSATVTKSFARRSGVTFPILIEGDGFPLTRAFDVQFTPTVFLIRPDGTVAFTAMGFLRDQVNELGDAVARELGKEPEPVIRADEEDVPFFVPG